MVKAGVVKMNLKKILYMILLTLEQILKKSVDGHFKCL